MIGSIIRLDDEDKEKNPNDIRNAPEVVEKALFDARVVMLTGEVNDGVARRVTERLFALAAQNANPITFVISSPGGHVESGDMIHDVIKFIHAPVRMLGTGWVASAGALIYCAAQRENRYCLPCDQPKAVSNFGNYMAELGVIHGHSSFDSLDVNPELASNLA